MLSTLITKHLDWGNKMKSSFQLALCLRLYFKHSTVVSFHLMYLSVSCMQVQWDEPSSILRPDRVSPWEIEPLVAASPPNTQPPQRNKRARPPVLPSAIQDISTLGISLFLSNPLHVYTSYLFLA